MARGGRGVSGRASDLTAWRIWQVVNVLVATQRNSQELAATAITQQMAEKVENGKQKEKTNEEKSVANCRRDQGGEEEEKDEIEEETEVEG